jgi:hypothetical protein
MQCIAANPSKLSHVSACTWPELRICTHSYLVREETPGCVCYHGWPFIFPEPFVHVPQQRNHNQLGWVHAPPPAATVNDMPHPRATRNILAHYDVYGPDPRADTPHNYT